MPFFDKHFTVQEANECLPRIREIFSSIHQMISKIQPSVSIHTKPTSNLPLSKTNGKHKNKDDQRLELQNLVTEITDQGIVIQDISRGLIDFPAFIQGEEVFLCYELADGETLQFYHPLNAGFGGRKPIPESEYF